MKHEPTTKTLMVRSEDLKCCIATGMGVLDLVRCVTGGRWVVKMGVFGC